MMIRGLKNWLRQKSYEGTTFSFFIKLMYGIFSNSYVQAGTSILGTVVIAIFIGRGYYGCYFWGTVIVYCMATILISWANQHLRKKVRDANIFQDALRGMSDILRAWAVMMQKSAKAINKVNLTADKKYLFPILDSMDFQSAAFTVCEKLKRYLSEGREADGIYVTVYQRYVKDSESRCKMIAYSMNHEPTSYGQEYVIPKSTDVKFGEVEFHSYVFAIERKDPLVFSTHDEIMSAFVLHNGCEEREEKIQQYICIPIAPAKEGVVFLLQIDTCLEGHFGQDKTAVEEFARNTIYPYAQALHLMYEQCRVMSQLAEN